MAHYAGIILSIISLPADVSVSEHNSKILGRINDSNKCEYKVTVQNIINTVKNC